MTAVATHQRVSIATAADRAVRDLMQARHWGGSSFINMPLIYPDGSHVTVKLDAVKGGVRVSDNGFAYRQLEHVGVQRSFGRTAGKAAEREELTVENRTIYVDVPAEGVARAICDVTAASWSVVDRIFAKLSDEDAVELEEHLRDRLAVIFPNQLVAETSLRGANVDWEVSAIVLTGGGATVFQAVSAHPNSINRASASFFDLGSIERPPHLVAVVPSKTALGPRLGLLSSVGAYVIEEGQSEDDYRRVAA